jgi:superfamily II DNA/RNA helicase
MSLFNTFSYKRVGTSSKLIINSTLSFCKKLGRFSNLKYALLVGGNELEGQFEKLAQNPDIIIATPGRVIHHLVYLF